MNRTPVNPAQPQPPTRRALLQDVQLMAQNEEFGFQPLWRLETIPQHAEFAAARESNG
jgi:hypothetical protein